MALTKLNNQSIAALTDFNLSHDDLPSGSILQVVSGSTIDYELFSAYDTWMASSLQVSITPKFANSKIMVFMSGSLRLNGSDASGANQINRGSYRIYNTVTNNPITNTGGYAERLQVRVTNETIGETNFPLSDIGIDTPNSTATQNYKAYLYLPNVGAASAYITHQGSSQMFAFEIAG
jgi:hypothetical protein